jgi:hypothetical protein
MLQGLLELVLGFQFFPQLGLQLLLKDFIGAARRTKAHRPVVLKEACVGDAGEDTMEVIGACQRTSHVVLEFLHLLHRHGVRLCSDRPAPAGGVKAGAVDGPPMLQDINPALLIKTKMGQPVS